MSYYGDYNYVTAGEREAKRQKSIEKLRKKNPDIKPVIITGRKIVRTWWGKAWIDNLSRYSDYSNRLGRGSSYVRQGAVLDLGITPGKITALVQGSRATPYKVEITITSLAPDIWKNITEICRGKIESLQELIEGKFPESLGDLFTTVNKGLFPSPKDISLVCNCPDWAVMCKHVAAVLYGVGSRMDDDPSLFFLLRNVRIDDLISKTVTEKSEKLIKKSDAKSSRVIDDDISEVFGIDTK